MYNETMYLNYYDLNNVEDLIDYVIDRLKVVSEEYLISNSHLWLPNDFPYIQEINRIEKLIDSCGKNYYLPEGWQECKVWLTGDETSQVIKSFSFEDINRWIINLQLLKASVDTFTFSTFRGSDIIINNLPVNSRFRWFKLYGDTYQQTYSGKQLWQNLDYYTQIPSANYTITNTGFTFTRNSLTGGRYISKRITVENGKNYTFSANITANPTSDCYMALYRGNVYGTLLQSTYSGKIKYTSTANEDLFFTFIINSGLQTATVNDIQVEIGEDKTSWEPYVGGTPSPNPDYQQEIQNVTGRQVVEINEQQFEINLGNIELNKIGEYQDYIDGDINDWYVNKYTNSVILDGSESTWGNWSSGTIHRYYIRLSDNNIVEDKGICNYFIRGNHADRFAVGNDLKFFVGIDNNLGVFNFRYDSITTLANFKAWLSTHNTKVVYVLAEPTRTKITNTELVGQLNNLAENKMSSGYKHIVVNGDLPGILNAEYLSNTGDYTTIWNGHSEITWNQESDIEWSDV